MTRALTTRPRRGSRAVRNVKVERARLLRAGVGRNSPSARRAARVLRAFHHDLSGLTSEREVLDRVCHDLVQLGGYRMAWVGLARNDQARSVQPAAHAGIAEGYLEASTFSWGDDTRGRGPTGTSIRTRVPIVARNILTEPRFEPWRLEALKRGFASSAALPLLTGTGSCLGALNVYAAEPDAFGREEIEVLRRIARELADGLRHRRRALD